MTVRGAGPQVTTVSPTYAAEALNGGAAGWLSSTLAKPEVGRRHTPLTYSGPLNVTK